MKDTGDVRIKDTISNEDLFAVCETQMEVAIHDALFPPENESHCGNCDESSWELRSLDQLTTRMPGRRPYADVSLISFTKAFSSLVYSWIINEDLRPQPIEIYEICMHLVNSIKRVQKSHYCVYWEATALSPMIGNKGARLKRNDFSIDELFGELTKRADAECHHRLGRFHCDHYRENHDVCALLDSEKVRDIVKELARQEILEDIENAGQRFKVRL